MSDSWSTENCPSWDKVPISGQHLCMSMQGSNIAEITKDNIEEVSEFIHKGGLLENLKTGQKLTLQQIKLIVRKAVGFKRSWD